MTIEDIERLKEGNRKIKKIANANGGFDKMPPKEVEALRVKYAYVKELREKWDKLLDTITISIDGKDIVINDFICGWIEPIRLHTDSLHKPITGYQIYDVQGNLVESLDWIGKANLGKPLKELYTLGKLYPLTKTSDPSVKTALEIELAKLKKENAI